MKKEKSTEEKIIEVAKKVFTKKGYAATRTRDIAEEAGLNLALLNYYFRSKENLFRIIIQDKFTQMFGILTPLLSDEHIPLEEKISTLVNHYVDLLLENPDLPIFVLNEVRSNKTLFEPILKSARLMTENVIQHQLDERNFNISTQDFVMNVISLAIFPFISKPLFISSGLLKEEDFEAFILERKKKIPEWIMLMLEERSEEVKK